MSYISASLKHHPEVIRMQKLTKTKLPYPHTREERMVEIKALKESLPVGASEITYCNCIIDELMQATDESYFNRITFLHQINVEYDTLLPKLRHVKDMNWFIWEAILTDLSTAYNLGLVSKTLIKEAADISAETKSSKHFNDDLRKRACEVEQQLEMHRKVLDEHYDEEDKERI